LPWCGVFNKEGEKKNWIMVQSLKDHATFNANGSVLIV
jgi:hypothetical protein